MAKRRGFVALSGCVSAAVFSLSAVAHAEPPFTPPRLFGPGGPLSPLPPGGPKPSSPGPELKPLGAGGGGADFPVFSALFNPALAPLGKWTARIEAAPVRWVSLALDGSLLKVDFPNVPTIEGKSLEVGVHVWPGGGGLRGFYVGPRYLYGKGDSGEAKGTLTGWGFDVGYQAVLGHFVLNVGAGVESGKLELSPKGDPAIINTLDPKLIDRLARESAETRVLPVATIGLGFALLPGGTAQRRRRRRKSNKRRRITRSCRVSSDVSECAAEPHDASPRHREFSPPVGPVTPAERSPMREAGVTGNVRAAPHPWGLRRRRHVAQIFSARSIDWLLLSGIGSLALLR